MNQVCVSGDQGVDCLMLLRVQGKNNIHLLSKEVTFVHVWK